MVDVPIPAAFYPKLCELKQFLASGAALRRAVAKFHGLLRNGRNRKKPYRNRASIGKTLGTIEPCRSTRLDHPPPDYAADRGRRFRLRRSRLCARRVPCAAARSSRPE